jgi:GNAT superfamily N-acetyltransferase
MSAMDIDYRKGPMRAEDYDALRTAVGWSSYEKAQIEEGLAKSLFIIVGYHQEKAIAMGRVIGDGMLAFYIQDVIVLPEFQGNGIGTQIMKRIMEYIDSRSVNSSSIGLMAATGKDAFYEGFGFVRRPNEKMGSGMSLWVKKDS